MRNRTALITLLGLMSASVANAEVKLSKVQAFLKKDGTCHFAVGFYNANAKTSQDPDLAEDVFCVMDTVVGQGTVNEKSGCGLMIFNVVTGGIRKATYNPMMPPAMVSPLILEGTKCKGDGFRKLLETNFESGYGQGPKSKELLYNGPMKGTAKTVVAYSENEQVLASYNSAIATIEAEEKVVAIEAAKQKQAEQAKQKNKPANTSTKTKSQSIDGLWRQSCHDEDGQHATSALRFQSGRVTQSIVVYLDDACFRVAATFVSTGTYKLGQELKGHSGSQVIDISFDSISLKPNTAEVASQFTGQTLHGKITWSAGVSQDISKSEMGRKTIGKTLFTYFSLSGGKLLFPKSDDMLKSTASTRTDQPVDQAHPYLRSTE